VANEEAGELPQSDRLKLFSAEDAVALIELKKFIRRERRKR
jgi:hypothetical protein